MPFRQFVFKMHSRCDLACDHCYIYRHADHSWRDRPFDMPAVVVSRAAARISEHVRAHDLPMAHVVFHGGEPLLAGHGALGRAAEELRSALDGICALDLRIQTDAVRLDEEFCELFRHFDIRVGISLDGDRSANDRHRRSADGRSSHAHVQRAVRLLLRPEFRHLYAGLLCTIDPENDRRAAYTALTALSPPRIDFLLPHATWDRPPSRPGNSPTACADWLITIFDRWLELGRPVPVRLFDSIRSLLRGGPSHVESLGTAPVDIVVIETDGTFGQADSLKTSYAGAPATGMNVFDHSLDEVLGHPGIRARRQGLAALCDECRSCPVAKVCGGGLHAHRFRSGRGFINPSVYCADLWKLISHVQQRFPDFTERTSGLGR